MLFICCAAAVSSLYAQSIYQKYNIYRNPLRVFINKFSLTATTGYGSGVYRHDFSGVYFYQDLGNQFVFSNQIENLGSTFSGFTDWLNDPQPGFETSLENPFQVPFESLRNPVNNPLLGNQTFLINTDTAQFGFKGAGRSIPVQLSIHYTLLDFRIGGGFMWERRFIRQFTPTSFSHIVRNSASPVKSTSYTRFYGLIGYKFYEFWRYDFVAEVQVGKVKQGKAFNRSVINQGLYTNIGVSIENNWSEYVRLVVRPSVDLQRYTVRLPDGASVTHRNPTFYLQVGLSFNIPEIPRSPMKNDHTQLKHIYTNPKTGRLMEVRGQPIWKRQNPKVGENNRKMWPKYRRRRKKMIK